jgi:hypothetical protein
MTDAQKLDIVKTLLSDGEMPPDEVLNTYITLSGNEILAWKYHLVGGVPEGVSTVPSIDEGAQIYAVVAGYTHAGAEGEKMHIENGVHRAFMYSDMIGYIRNHVLPYVRVGAIS